MGHWNEKGIWISQCVHHGLVNIDTGTRYELTIPDIYNAVNYLLNHRLQWGKPDTLSLLTSALDDRSVATTENGELELYPSPEYFKADVPFNSDLICIIQNDWPYSGTADIIGLQIARASVTDGVPVQFLLKLNIPWSGAESPSSIPP